ncbi:MAG: AAA family ATPase [Candidatus Omnitrophica bacterium]|nr:AAA family ATPase [Candidatus Omnitrophota bacterium]MCB9747712.1 AAA family ATPase [Candidatus Omnitrophota bacterium]
MYKEYYQLTENPFNITSDPDFFFSSLHHREAYSHLQYGISQRKGIIVITGEIGTGKTTLCRTFLNRLDDNTKTALILNPNFSALQLLQLIVKDLGIQGRLRNKFDLVNALNEFLLNESSLGNNVVIIVDEAQNLGVKQLEQIRLLSNLETEKEKLLQIVLIGQPELHDLLKLPNLRQLNQRVSVRYHILPLSKDELHEYIVHRLNIANSPINLTPKVTFSNEAINAIYRLSKGTPRMINIICDRALLAGFAIGTYTIDENIVYESVKEVGCK